MSARSSRETAHAADVVPVSVGEHVMPTTGVDAISDVAEVGQDDVDAGLVPSGRAPAVDDDQQLFVELEDGQG